MHRFVLAVVLVCLASPAAAQTAAPQGTFEVGFLGTNFGLGGRVAARFHLHDRITLDLRTEADRRLRAYVAGYVPGTGVMVRTDVGATGVLLRRGPVDMLFGGAAGVRVVRSDEATPKGDRESIEFAAEIAMKARVELHPRVRFTAGVEMPLFLALSPEVEPAVIGYPFTLGVDVALTDALALVLEGRVGGLFGFEGDGPKAEAGGRVALQYRFGGAVERSDDPALPVDLFVGVEWRAYGFHGHFSHGPGFQAGLLTAKGWLKLGFAGYSRPGPMNPAEFTLTPAEPYQGKTSLQLRSDGGFIGGFVTPVINLPVAWLKFEIPILLGNGAYGFYLQPDDRDTPDDERVSVWENALMDGRDAGSGFVVQPGFNVAFAPEKAPWLRPYVGVSYAFNIGYDAFMAENYGGLSVVVGTQIGTF